MTACTLLGAPDVELYFYDELGPADRARVAAHLRSCGSCRQSLDDLEAIRRALAGRPFVEAPAAGEWSGFMRRLDDAIASAGTRPGTTPPVVAAPARRRSAVSVRALVAFAAMLALVTFGVVLASRVRPGPPVRLRVSVAPHDTPADGPAVSSIRALREESVEHLERSKLVVLGLATRDPHARAEDWQYERTLAGSLLTDTRLYRQAALRGGAADVAGVMRDLETVLLEASMSDVRDRDALERVQRLIARRDLVLKMQVVSAGPAGN